MPEVKNKDLRGADDVITGSENAPAQVDILAAIAVGKQGIGDSTGRFDRGSIHSEAT